MVVGVKLKVKLQKSIPPVLKSVCSKATSFLFSDLTVRHMGWVPDVLIFVYFHHFSSACMKVIQYGNASKSLGKSNFYGHQTLQSLLFLFFVNLFIKIIMALVLFFSRRDRCTLSPLLSSRLDISCRLIPFWSAVGKIFALTL